MKNTHKIDISCQLHSYFFSYVTLFFSTILHFINYLLHLFVLHQWTVHFTYMQFKHILVDLKISSINSDDCIILALKTITATHIFVMFKCRQASTAIFFLSDSIETVVNLTVNTVNAYALNSCKYKVKKKKKTKQNCTHGL